MLQARSRRTGSGIAAILGVVLLVGCSAASEPDTPAPSSSGERAQRIEAVRQARAEVVDPAQALGTAAATLTARLDALMTEPVEAEVERVRSAVEELEMAREEVEEITLDASTPELAATAEVLDQAMGGAAALVQAAIAVADAAAHGLDADQRLQELVANWDEPGSRSELLARLEETALSATALAEGAIGTAPEECPGPVSARADAAAFVAEASIELREFVAAYDGLAFDERREQLDAAPYGLDDDGQPRRPGAAIDPEACPALGAATEAASTVVDALRQLEQALNPDDLVE